jgi:multidrug efflux pump
MNISAPFIKRPVGTALLTLGIAMAGALAFRALPVSPLPRVDFPTINVSAGLPGASPETMASSVATPLERQLSHVAGVTEMTSSSGLGSTNITLQFDLNRDINGAARDVQAAINAARNYLPSNLPMNPSYRKMNPAESPIMILGLSSDIYDQGKMYDIASTIVEQKLLQIDGVGTVNVGGASLPAVRISVNPTLLNGYGMTLSDVQSMLSAQNANAPKGQLADGEMTSDILANDQLSHAAEYKPLIVGYRNGAAVKLSDIADVSDSVEDTRSAAFINGKRVAALMIFKQPGANIIETVDRIKATLPQLQHTIPAGITFTTVMDRTTTIRASVREVERTLVISIGLVVLVVLIFLRSFRAMAIAGVAVPVSLIGTFAVMYLLDYSLDNLSLMALTISTGFVVDDAIVVMENVSRYIEGGMRPYQAALKGAREIGFTVLSISLSLVAVFIPILMMGGVVGRLFREFAVTLSVAIMVSLVISLTTTPTMCARFIRFQPKEGHSFLYRLSEGGFNRLLEGYGRSLTWVLRHRWLVFGVFLATIGLNFYLMTLLPRGFFPQQDTGTVFGGMQLPQDTSFQKLEPQVKRLSTVILQDPAVASVVASTGGRSSNNAMCFISLKPLSERKISAMEAINRLRPAFTSVPGARVFAMPAQDLNIGGMQTNAQYQYTLLSDRVQDLADWGPRLLQAARKVPGLADVNSTQQIGGLQVTLDYDRATATRMGITPGQINDALYLGFGQAQVSTIFSAMNQYHVVMEVDPQFRQDPRGLEEVYLRSSSGGIVPLSTFATYKPSAAPLSVNHNGLFPSMTISFNLLPGIALSDATKAIREMQSRIGMPPSIRGTFSGTMRAYNEAMGNEWLLIITAILAVYIVLGILYESLIHPVTILSTLPPASLGAILALLVSRTQLDIIALIGIILLIGLVKKNAIMMIDFALLAEREQGKDTREAIYQACMLRFRPIMMTTMAALFGALPLALGRGTGFELRRPLGITIIGGLIVSQVLTLYTTPVVYLLMDRVRVYWETLRRGLSAGSREAAEQGA